MATIVNNPSGSDGGGILGTVIGVILVVVLGIIFFIYGVPILSEAFRDSKKNDDVVPDEIDININDNTTDPPPAPEETTEPTPAP